MSRDAIVSGVAMFVAIGGFLAIAVAVGLDAAHRHTTCVAPDGEVFRQGRNIDALYDARGFRLMERPDNLRCKTWDDRERTAP